MALQTAADVAMVLPLPVARVAEDALSFVDLSGCPKLFDQLDDLFPSREAFSFDDAVRSAGAPQPKSKLVVHEVGSFEASYVPSLADMDRLDERFRIPETVWRGRPEYAGYGFAVFKLKKGAKKQIHPMAMRFDVADKGALFFPTVHVHDGQLHETAAFDHVLYYQLEDGQAATARKPDGSAAEPEAARYKVEQRVTVASTRGVALEGGRIFRLKLRGKMANADVRVTLAGRDS
jgi:hypothetical protein